MIELGCNLNLEEEPVCSYRSREFRLQHLYRDVAPVFAVSREVNGRHTTVTDDTLKLVASGESRLQNVRYV